MELLGKKTLWLSSAVWFLHSFVLVGVVASVVPGFCLVCFAIFALAFSLSSFTLAFCLTSHHVKTWPTTGLSLFIHYIIMGLIFPKAEQHIVLFFLFLLRSTKQSSRLCFQDAV